MREILEVPPTTFLNGVTLSGLFIQYTRGGHFVNAKNEIVKVIFLRIIISNLTFQYEISTCGRNPRLKGKLDSSTEFCGVHLRIYSLR